MKTLALVPARSGSKGIPNKNGRMLGGKPLLVRAVEVGLATCDRTYVSTDSTDYALMAVTAGAEVMMRPDELATDAAPMLPVIQHAIQKLKPWYPDVVVLLQPTQPLRRAGHVLTALKILENAPKVDSVVSVVPVPGHYLPDVVMRLGENGLEPYTGRIVTRRQEAQPAYSREGTVYATRTSVIEAGSIYGTRCVALHMDPKESVTLDSEEDWARAEQMVRRRGC